MAVEQESGIVGMDNVVSSMISKGRFKNILF